MNANSSSVGSTQAFGSRFRGNFSFNNEHWEALNFPLDDSPQILFTNTQILMLFLIYQTLFLIYLLVLLRTTSTNFKFGVRKYFDKVTVDVPRRA